jgi:hypothetical protein
MAFYAARVAHFYRDIKKAPNINSFNCAAIIMTKHYPRSFKLTPENSLFLAEKEKQFERGALSK